MPDSAQAESRGKRYPSQMKSNRGDAGRIATTRDSSCRTRPQPHRVLEKLLLPGINLVRVNLIALVQVPLPSLFPQRLQRNPCFQSSPRSSALFSSSSLAPYVATKPLRIQLVNRSQMRGPLQIHRERVERSSRSCSRTRAAHPYDDVQILSQNLGRTGDPNLAELEVARLKATKSARRSRYDRDYTVEQMSSRLTMSGLRATSTGRGDAV